jgi:N-acetylmuramoyl-L-alanine amidase
MRKHSIRFCRLSAALICSVFLCLAVSSPVFAAVIVLDPGHGGNLTEDIGAVYPPFSEQDMDLFTAQLLKAELELYDGVTVYLTRTANTPVTLQQRVDFAKSVGADFLYSVHYNATGSHTYHGSEVYISAQKSMYERSFPMAWNSLQELAALGMHPKGVRVRLGKSGVTDYYGILRIASLYGIPAAIVEHCYLDNPTDRAFLLKEPSPVFACTAFAHADATAIAKTLHLKSRALGVDYSAHPNMQISVPVSIVTIDITPEMLGAGS